LLSVKSTDERLRLGKPRECRELEKRVGGRFAICPTIEHHEGPRLGDAKKGDGKPHTS